MDTGEAAYREYETLLPDTRAEVIDGFNNLVDKFNGAWWKHNLVARWMMRRAIDDIQDHIDRLLDVLDHAVDHYYPVLSLFSASQRWTSAVMTPLSEIYGAMPPGSRNRDLIYWDDAAREAYDNIVVEQQNAAGSARDLAAFMSRWLSEIGRENTTFVTHLVREAGKIVSKLVQAAAEAATFFGAPFAIQDLAGMIGQIVDTLFGTLAKIAEDVTSAIDRVNDAENEVADHSHFPGGHWPTAVTRA